MILHDKGGGGVQTLHKKYDIIYDQPLTWVVRLDIWVWQTFWRRAYIQMWSMWTRLWKYIYKHIYTNLETALLNIFLHYITYNFKFRCRKSLLPFTLTGCMAYHGHHYTKKQALWATKDVPRMSFQVTRCWHLWYIMMPDFDNLLRHYFWHN